MNWTAMTAIIALAALEGVALATHTDGAMFGIVIAAIAGLGGFQVHKWTAGRHQDKQPTKKEGE